MIFKTAPPFNKHTTKYSWDNWNRASLDPNQHKALTHLVKGNFTCFMNHLLEFEPGPTVHPWIPKKERKYGATR